MDSLWNEPQRLSPHIAAFSHLNTDPNSTFKKTVVDLAKVADEEKRDVEQRRFKNLMTTRTES